MNKIIAFLRRMEWSLGMGQCPDGRWEGHRHINSVGPWEAPMKKAAFILGSLEYKAARRGEAITDDTLEILNKIANRAGVDASIIFATQEPLDAGKSKSKLGIKKLKAERARVLSEIGDCHPDLVICFGPVATAVVFGKGNLVEGELLRRAHHPLGDDQPPVYVTFSMEYAAVKTGLVKWLSLDVEAAVNGWAEPQWGDYIVLQPGTLEWDQCPKELQCFLTHGARQD